MSSSSPDGNSGPTTDPDINALIEQGILAIDGEPCGLDTKIALTPKGRELGKSLRDKK